MALFQLGTLLEEGEVLGDVTSGKGRYITDRVSCGYRRNFRMGTLLEVGNVTLGRCDLNWGCYTRMEMLLEMLGWG